MEPEDRTQSLETTDEHHSETAPSRGRRGFLRKAAATGILGMTGMAAATEVASAGEADENNRSSHGKRITVRAIDGSGTHFYSFVATGDCDHIRRFTEGNDNNQDIPRGTDDGAYGYISGGHRDDFAFNGDLTYIAAGDVGFYIDLGGSSH